MTSEKLRVPPEADHSLRKTDRCRNGVKGTSVVITKASMGKRK